MSVEAMVAVRDLPKQGISLDPRNRFVLYALANYADDTGKCWPSYRTLEQWTGYTRRSIIRTMNELRELGLVTTEARQRDNGSAASNIIRLVFMDPQCQADTRVVTHSHQGGDTVSPLELSLELPLEGFKENVEKQQKHRVARKIDSMTEDIENVVRAWNENRGVLPRITTLNEHRKRRIIGLIREHDKEAATLIAAATKQVSNNPFWQENRYTFDNLLTGGKYLSHAEAHQTTQQPRTKTKTEVPF
jgi:hypothetical protein